MILIALPKTIINIRLLNSYKPMDMKNRILIGVLICCSGLFAACNGDHSTRSNIDTVKNQYGADTAKANRSTVDTSKVKSPDSSATGGIKAAKDTAKQKTNPKK